MPLCYFSVILTCYLNTVANKQTNNSALVGSGSIATASVSTCRCCSVHNCGYVDAHERVVQPSNEWDDIWYEIQRGQQVEQTQQRAENCPQRAAQLNKLGSVAPPKR